MNHLTPDQLSALLDGALSDGERERAERHMAECATCRDALAALAAQDRALTPLLEHDPGDAYFQSFAARVEDRIRAAGLKGAQAREGDRWLGWLRSPRRLAWVGAVAVVTVGAGVVMLTTRVERAGYSAFEGRQRMGGPSTRSERDAAPNQRFAEPPSVGTTRAPAPPTPSTLAGKREDDRVLTEDQATAQLSNEASMPDAKEAEVRKDGGVSTTRLTPTRRTSAGEYVPVTGQAPTPRAPAAASAPAEENKLMKPSASPADRAGLAAPAKQQETLEMKATGQQQGTVCGRVLDTSRNPVARARVTLVESGHSVATDAQGRFCIAAAPGDHVVSVMAVGFQETRLSARAGSGQPDVALTLRAVSVLEDPATVAARGGRTQSMYTFLGREPNDVFAALPDSTRARVREAQAITADGQARRAADRLEEGAQKWEQVAPRLTSDAMRAEAGFRLAEARVSAWRLDPEGARKRDAQVGLLQQSRGFAVAPESLGRRDAAIAAVRGALTARVSPAQRQTLETWQRELAPGADR